MNVSHFIGISSAVLLTWLGYTYLQQVPCERYPTQKRHTANATITTPADSDVTITATATIIE